MERRVFSLADIQQMDKDFRTQLINGLSGYKSANLVGTRSAEGLSNLAIFSSVVHLGADPALMGMIARPFSPTTRRHTVENILSTGFYTLNQVGADFFAKAHQTSARYAEEASEFAAVGLREEYLGDFPAPFVGESLLKIGLKLEEIVPLAINGTQLIIGSVQYLSLPSLALLSSGHIELEALNAVAIGGLDTYY